MNKANCCCASLKHISSSVIYPQSLPVQMTVSPCCRFLLSPGRAAPAQPWLWNPWAGSGGAALPWQEQEPPSASGAGKWIWAVVAAGNPWERCWGGGFIRSGVGFLLILKAFLSVVPSPRCGHGHISPRQGFATPQPLLSGDPALTQWK